MSNNPKQRKQGETEPGFYRATLFALQDTVVSSGFSYVLDSTSVFPLAWKEIVKLVVKAGLLPWLGMQDFENGAPQGDMWLLMSEIAQVFKANVDSAGETGPQYFTINRRLLKPCGKLAIKLHEAVPLMRNEATNCKSKFAKKSHVVDRFDREVSQQFTPCQGNSSPAYLNNAIKLVARPIKQSVSEQQMIENRVWCQTNATKSKHALDKELKIERISQGVEIELVYIHDDNTEKVVFQSNVKMSKPLTPVSASDAPANTLVPPTMQSVGNQPVRRSRVSRIHATTNRSVRTRVRSHSAASVADSQATDLVEEEKKGDTQVPFPFVDDDDAASVMTIQDTTRSEPDTNTSAAATITPLQPHCTNDASEELIEVNECVTPQLEKPQDSSMEWPQYLSVPRFFPWDTVDVHWCESSSNYPQKKRKSLETVFLQPEMQDDAEEDPEHPLKKMKRDDLQSPPSPF